MTSPIRFRVSTIRRVVAILAILCASAATAHPHVWITYTAKIHMRGATITGITETWHFTEGFPVMLIGIDHLPPGGPLGPAQTGIFRQQAFSSLAPADYFSHLLVDGEPQHFAEPADFRVSVENGRIEYTFTLPLAKPVAVAGKRVQFGVWDGSFYVDYEPGTGAAVSLDSGAAPTCKARNFDDQRHPVFYGTVVPQATAITC
ncbi:ABC transporter substrate-binding protein [Paraburkholderia steynii]|uniref:ABC transporter substrate-binding protein n=1 Tax=Paraburkholderia steynii TaxID=1245441 RepID=A0A4R0XA68_9BURK|nr:ABC transporter substrate-binding protein [Paraburkholderia steynii]